MLQDLGSTNGTFVGPVRIREVFLAENKTFQVGLTTLAFDPKDEIVNVVPLKSALRGNGREIRSHARSFYLKSRRNNGLRLVLGKLEQVRNSSAQQYTRGPNAKIIPLLYSIVVLYSPISLNQLFGHTRCIPVRCPPGFGAHTGIFIDELGELPLSVNPRSCAFWSNARCVAWAGAA